MIGLLNPTTGALSSYETNAEEYTFVKGERYYFSAMMIRFSASTARFSDSSKRFCGLLTIHPELSLHAYHARIIQEKLPIGTASSAQVM